MKFEDIWSAITSTIPADGEPCTPPPLTELFIGGKVFQNLQTPPPGIFNEPMEGASVQWAVRTTKTQIPAQSSLHNPTN